MSANNQTNNQISSFKILLSPKPAIQTQRHKGQRSRLTETVKLGCFSCRAVKWVVARGKWPAANGAWHKPRESALLVANCLCCCFFVSRKTAKCCCNIQQTTVRLSLSEHVSSKAGLQRSLHKAVSNCTADLSVKNKTACHSSSPSTLKERVSRTRCDCQSDRNCTGLRCPAWINFVGCGCDKRVLQTRTRRLGSFREEETCNVL